MCGSMISCPRCGGSLESTMICSACHYALGESAIIELYRQRDYCPNCGAENHNYSKFCHRCQAQIRSDVQVEALYTRVISRSLKERAYQAELSGQHSIAKELYQDLKEFETQKTTPIKLQHHRVPSVLVDKETLTGQLVQKGIGISYNCCYCGAVLTFSAMSPDIPNYCPQCGAELDTNDFEK